MEVHPNRKHSLTQVTRTGIISAQADKPQKTLCSRLLFPTHSIASLLLPTKIVDVFMEDPTAQPHRRNPRVVRHASSGGGTGVDCSQSLCPVSSSLPQGCSFDDERRSFIALRPCSTLATQQSKSPSSDSSSRRSAVFDGLLGHSKLPATRTASDFDKCMSMTAYRLKSTPCSPIKSDQMAAEATGDRARVARYRVTLII